MSALVGSEAPPTGTPDPAAPGPEERATFADAVRSEWTKLRTLRFTPYALVIAPLLASAYAVMLGYLAAMDVDPSVKAELATFDPTATSLQGVGMAQEVLGVLGVIVMTSEYASGMIRTSLTAVPLRGRLLVAKAGVFAALAVPLGQVTAFVPFLVGQAVLRAFGARYDSLAQPQVLRAVAGAGLYLALVGLLGVAVGTLLRHTAGGLAVMVLGTLVLPTILGLLPGSAAHLIATYWPINAGRQVMVVHPPPGTLAPWAGLTVLCAWTAALLVAALGALKMRDA